MSDDWNKLKHLVDLSAENARLKAEVERLTERNKFLEQIDSYLQGANENAYEKRCDELEAEVERLKEGNDCLGQMHDKEMERSAYLLEEFNRTTAWGRGLESDLSHARVEISFLKSDVDRLTEDNRQLKKAFQIAEGIIKRMGNAAENTAKEGKPSEQKSPSFIEDLGNGVEKHDLLFRYPSKETPPHA